MTETLTLKATGVLPHAIPMVWPSVVEFLRPAVEVEGSVTNLDAVIRNLVTGVQSLFVVYEPETSRVVGAVVAEICPRPEARVCAVPFLGGVGFDRWGRIAEDAVTAWAKANGCTVFEALVRRGLAKHYRERGFIELGTVIRRAI